MENKEFYRGVIKLRNMDTDKLFEEVENRKESSNFIINNDWGSSTVSSTSLLSWTNPTITQLKRNKFFGITWWKKYQEISVEDFFGKVKRTKRKIEIIEGILDKYFQQIGQAEKFGQTALVERLRDDIEVVRAEALAVVCGVKEYLTQSQIDSLIKKSVKNIEMTSIKNFIRPIPSRLVKIKVALDKEKVFAEYVILHYDPKQENSQLTEKEIEKKKDPILFGIIKGSRNFYYIGDWIDEHCNLTLKEAVEVIGEKSKAIIT